MSHPFDTAPCGLFSFNREGTLVGVNVTLCRWLGLELDEWVDQPVDFLLTLPSRSFYQTHLFPLLGLQEEVTEIFLTLAKKNKEPLPVLLTGCKNLHEGAIVYTCACITVHHRKQFEDELIAARHTAEQALRDNSALQQLTEDLRNQAGQLDRQLTIVRQQHAELTQLSRVVTHELQEPLRKISVFSQMLTDFEPSALQVEPARDRLKRATEQMRVVVAGLQQYIWIQESPISPMPLNMPELLQTVRLQLVAHFRPEDWELSVETLPSIVADAKQIELLLFHLLSNAIQFRKEGGPAKIAIRTTLLRKNRFQELSSHYRYEQFVQLEVTDEGIGFEPEFQQTVFGLFKRLHHGQNRGVGLALCKTIAERHGGEISIHSVPGKGTTVTVLLPVLPLSANV